MHTFYRESKYRRKYRDPPPVHVSKNDGGGADGMFTSNE